MGAGGHWYPKDPQLTPFRVRVEGHPSTLLAEGAAIIRALEDTDLNEPLLIFTDSANMLFHIASCTSHDWWVDLSDHPDTDMLEKAVTLIQARTAATHFVKVKSHVGHEGNDAADILADEGRSSEDIVYYSRSTPNEICSLGLAEDDSKTTWAKV